jgi:hypothetical protein
MPRLSFSQWPRSLLRRKEPDRDRPRDAERTAPPHVLARRDEAAPGRGPTSCHLQRRDLPERRCERVREQVLHRTFASGPRPGGRCHSRQCLDCARAALPATRGGGPRRARAAVATRGRPGAEHRVWGGRLPEVRGAARWRSGSPARSHCERDAKAQVEETAERRSSAPRIARGARSTRQLRRGNQTMILWGFGRLSRWGLMLGLARLKLREGRKRWGRLEGDEQRELRCAAWSQPPRDAGPS